MPDAKIEPQDQSPRPPASPPTKSRSAAPVVWPSASTSGGGAYMPSLPKAEPDSSEAE